MSCDVQKTTARDDKSKFDPASRRSLDAPRPSRSSPPSLLTAMPGYDNSAQIVSHDADMAAYAGRIVRVADGRVATDARRPEAA